MAGAPTTGAVSTLALTVAAAPFAPVRASRRLNAFIHRRSDSVVQPMDAATSARFIPLAMSLSASACCSELKRLPLLGIDRADFPLREER
jgi:hypothetical protein